MGTETLTLQEASAFIQQVLSESRLETFNPWNSLVECGHAILHLCLQFHMTKECVLTTGVMVCRIVQAVLDATSPESGDQHYHILAYVFTSLHDYLKATWSGCQGWKMLLETSQREIRANTIANELRVHQTNLKTASGFLHLSMNVQVAGSVSDLMTDMYSMLEKLERMDYYIDMAQQKPTKHRQVDQLLELAIQLQCGLDCYKQNVSLLNLQTNPNFEETVRTSFEHVVMKARESWSSSGREMPVDEMIEEWILASDDIHFNPDDESTWLGRGVSATVYLGKYQDKFVAVKKFKPTSRSSSNSMDLERAIRKEIKAWRSVSHEPFILTLIGVCTKVTSPLLVSEYCPDTITRYVYMHPEKIVSVVYQLALGIRMLHKYGVIHRDLNGRNVMVREDGSVAIADFGLSRSTESVLTEYSNTRNFVGTLNWMSPEQRFSPRKVSVHDDTPYRGYSPEEIEEAIKSEDERPERPEKLSEGNEFLWHLAQECWKLDPKQRPTSAQIVDALECHYRVGGRQSVQRPNREDSVIAKTNMRKLYEESLDDDFVYGNQVLAESSQNGMSSSLEASALNTLSAPSVSSWMDVDRHSSKHAADTYYVNDWVEDVLHYSPLHRQLLNQRQFKANYSPSSSQSEKENLWSVQTSRVLASRSGSVSPIETTKFQNEEITIWMGTWYLGESDLSNIPNGATDRMIKSFAPLGHDLYVLSIQDALNESVFNSTLQYLNSQGRAYYRLDLRNDQFLFPNKTASVNAMFDSIHSRAQGFRLLKKATVLAVIVAEDRRSNVSLLRAAVHKFNLVSGTRGGVAVALKVNQETLCFVNCNLDSDWTPDVRRKRIRQLHRKLAQDMGHASFDLTEQFHHLFWMGHLGHRISNVDEKKAVLLLGSHAIDELFKLGDGLTNDRSKGLLGELSEPPMRAPFYPTSTKIRGRGTVDLSDRQWPLKVYQISVKEPFYKGGGVKTTMPGWTDRILYNSIPTKSCTIELEAPGYTSSSFDSTGADIFAATDHSPVHCVFNLFAPKIAPSRTQTTILNIYDLVIEWKSHRQVPAKALAVAPLMGEDDVSRFFESLGERTVTSTMQTTLSFLLKLNHQRKTFGRFTHDALDSSQKDDAAARYNIHLSFNGEPVFLEKEPLRVKFSARIVSI
ncbi:hypothetical protein LEN26_014860 [Aphanomyces euteiches]|nr:hypothetical protein LEN26_014860 [Aphanomyces euteiches]